MTLQVVESPGKKKRKTKSSFSPLSSSLSFSLLPYDITINYLARIPRSYYPRLSTVSKSFRSLLSSTELYAARSHLGNTEQYLYVCRWDPSYQSPQWFTLCLNPKKKTTGKMFVPIPSSNFHSLSKSTVVVGYEIYIIGGSVYKPSSTVRILDCRNHTWHDAPSMNVAREYAASCVYAGKIYVLGGCKGLEDDEPWAEVFDIKTQIWEPLPDPGTEIRKLDINIIAEIQGKIKFGSLNKMYAYDTNQCIWKRCGNESKTFPRSQCVIENVSYSYGRNYIYGPIRCSWYDIEDGTWKEVKGLDSLRDKHMENVSPSSSMTKLVSCGGKLILIWEVCMMHGKKIWCAVIVVEKRDGGEVWGNMEWVGVVHTVPISCQPLHCLAVSV